MFRHIVLLKWVDEAPDAVIENVVASLEGLPSQIPEIRSYVIGRDAGLNPDSYSVAITADFDSASDYLVYRDHPAHRSVIVEQILPILDSRASLQFEL